MERKTRDKDTTHRAPTRRNAHLYGIVKHRLQGDLKCVVLPCSTTNTIKVTLEWTTETLNCLHLS